MSMNIGYKLKRKQVQFRLYHQNKKVNNALNKMTPEQLKIYNLVTETVIKDNTSIMFVPDSTDILISIPNMLIELYEFTVFIQNSHGFYSSVFPSDSYKLITNIIHIEGNRLRRKLKYRVKQRINSFLHSIIETEEVFSEFDSVNENLLELQWK